MNNETILLLEKYFDVAFAAPDGVKKLRELILSLAMQGKLVPQDPRDQSARELLKEIEAEKSRLVKDGKIKASKPLPEIKPDEVPYDLPKSWEWVRIPDCYYGIGNKTNQIQTKDYLESGTYPVIDQGKSFIAGYLNDQSKLLEITKPVVIFGDHTRNIKFIDFSFVIGADGVKILCPYEGIFPRYLYHAIQSYDLTSRGYARHFRVLNEKLVPICPLAEQRRIVAKIDELMARCDELEKLRQVHTQNQITVHNAALNQLLTAKDHNDFKTSWHFITQHFGELYSVKANVAELRKAILQLAVMGKLVPQDPNDQPASELLNAIEVERNSLVKEGKIKTSKPLPQVNPEEYPFELPNNWFWARLGNISLFSDSGWSPQCLSNPRYGHEWGVLKVSAVSWGEFRPEENKALPQGMEAKQECEVKLGDFLISRANTEELVARSVIVNVSPVQLMMSDKIVRFRLSQKIDKNFINLANLSQFAREYYARNASGTSSSMKNISREAMNNLPIPLPPLAEQHRIVAKIDQLMTLCDELEKQIDIADRKKTNLLNSVMAKI